MSYRIIFTPPPGICINQTQDGKLIIHYTVDMIAPMRERLEKLRADFLDQAIAHARAQKEAEIQRQQLPATRLQLLDEEISALESQRPSAV